MGQLARVSADPSKCWHYGWVMTPVFLVVCPILAFGALVGESGHQSFGTFLLWTISAVVLCACFAFGVGLFWRARSARVEYLVDDEGFRVLRAGRQIRFIERRHIDSFQIDGVMNVKECLFGQIPPPSWPQAIIGLHPSGRRVQHVHATVLPAIMIWGSREIRAAEWELEKALRATGPLK